MYPNPGFPRYLKCAVTPGRRRGTTALFSHREGRRRTRCIRSRGLPRYLEVRGDVREEEDAAARFQHQGREEESPDVSASGRLGPV
ncbi:hypothetical protein SAMN05444279_103167 [Ruegeria intermedia]|uniref:Uncharacterized protein n=1 Tax=Ruegeria intermedia TaxID=996115 RepID=A0A1M4U4I2_9RHOB|nr:hypothetical protein SAMN05444279_103167 [Ruegeria intermedia]